MDAILEGLNKEQTEAVTHGGGPLLIIAGAGTGKTRVITQRIAWLLSEGRALTNEILALTFTDKAAMEMEERVDRLVPYGYTDIWISTFHAFGDRVLRENALEVGLNPDFQVLTRPEAAVFFREHLFEFNLNYYRPLSDPTRFIDALIKLFSRVKDEDVSPKEYLIYADKLSKKAKDNPDDLALQEEAQQQAEIANCYAKYQELLNREGKIDFGNQFYLTLELLRNHPLILKKYQEQFKYILVDEFQDTNYAQLQLIKLLATKNKNITVVSDDDQCIFRFRGAAYSNILNFMDAYPEAKKISLIQNYRSTQPILDSAYRLIQFNNPDRFEVRANINKRLIGISPDGQSPKHLYFDTLSTESDEVAKMIKDKVGNDEYNYNDFAILVRSNSDAEAFLRSLNMHGIPWIFSGKQGLYTREEVRLCIAFLRAMANISDSVSLFYLATSHIYNIPVADLSQCMHISRRRNRPLFSVLGNINSIEELSEISKETQDVIDKFISDIKKYLELSRNFTAGRLLYTFLTGSGYVKDLVKNPSLENEEKLQNLAKFFELVRNFQTVAKEDRVIYFINYLDLLIQAGDDPQTQISDMDTQAVNVLTIHKAKGLEFSCVFMVSLVNGKFPWPRRSQALELPESLIKDILPQGDFHIEEERRLFYVGMTRAKKELYLSSASDYGGTRLRKISQFLIEALDMKKEEAKPKKATAVEAIHRNAPKAESVPRGKTKPKKDEILKLSFYQIDDYLTCPLKYKYVHILHVPIMEHHTVLYGKAIHDAVQKYYQYKMSKRPISADDLVDTFTKSFRLEGFLAEEHQSERLKAGSLALERFYKDEEKRNILPTYIEKEFSFLLDNDRIRGRWDRVDITEEVAIVDFKSSPVKDQKQANKKTKESLQLSIYCLAYQNIYGKVPDKVKLYFLESGLIGEAQKDEKTLNEAKSKIKEASCGIRSNEFPAQPRFGACNWCAFNQICPSALMT